MTRIQLRRGTAAQWSSANTVLAAGEAGFETDTSKFKIGDGTKTWTELGYADSGARTPTQYSLSIGAELNGGSATTFNGASAVSIDLPSTIARNISGSAASLTTSRTINGASFNGSSNIIVGGGIYGATAGVGAAFRNIFISPSTSAPTNPVNGDVWIAWTA